MKSKTELTTVANIADKLRKLAELLSTSGVDPSETYIEFEVSDRSEGTTITCDDIEQIVFDLMNPSKVIIKIS